MGTVTEPGTARLYHIVGKAQWFQGNRSVGKAS